MQLPELTPLILILLSLFGLKLIIDWLITGLVVFSKKKENSGATPPVSIIICARNEYENLMDFVPKIMEQDYPNFEVIIVNDRSIDETQVLLNAFENKYANLKITKVQESELHWAGKKFALTIGLKSAMNDQVLLTDADCYPASNKWIREMTSQFSNKNKIVLGYGSYQKKAGIINKLIRCEALSIALQYMGMAKLGLPYMGVGRNLAYDKNLFFDNRGFASHQFMPSGDDDLFVNEVANSKNTAVSFNEASYTISPPETSFSAWIEQKRRHLTTSNRYSFITKASLVFISVLRYCFYLVLLSSFFSSSYITGIVIIALQIISMISLNYLPAKKTKSLDLLVWLPISEIFLLLFYPFLFIWNTIVSGSPWKNY